jgi:hypothetical protein
LEIEEKTKETMDCNLVKSGCTSEMLANNSVMLDCTWEKLVSNSGRRENMMVIEVNRLDLLENIEVMLDCMKEM